MGVKPDHWIVRMANNYRMIEPFEKSQVSSGTISYGVSSYGYDLRLDQVFQVYRGTDSDLVDPKATQDMCFKEIKAEKILARINELE